MRGCGIDQILQSVLFIFQYGSRILDLPAIVFDCLYFIRSSIDCLQSPFIVFPAMRGSGKDVTDKNIRLGFAFLIGIDIDDPVRSADRQIQFVPDPEIRLYALIQTVAALIVFQMVL